MSEPVESMEPVEPEEIEPAVAGLREEAARELDRIAEDGRLTKEAVLKEAEAPESPLHRYFTWDDSEAAGKYRLSQALRLIMRYRVVIEDLPPVRMMYSVSRSGEDPSFVPLNQVHRDPALYAQVIADCRKAIRGYRNRLSAFEQAGPLVAQLDALLGELAQAS